jgi:uncharacterized LabA/DUF88 family protein
LKCIILIDGGYFDYINKYLHSSTGDEIDLEKFSKELSGNHSNIRTNFYHSHPYKGPEANDEDEKRYKHSQKFHEDLDKIPNTKFIPIGRVKPQSMKCPLCKNRYKIPKQKGVDVGIALDLVRLASKKIAELIILVSGDEDLFMAVQMAQDELINVHVYFCADSRFGIFGSTKLNRTADNRIRMDIDFLKKCRKEP